jgi:hypothetical protein
VVDRSELAPVDGALRELEVTIRELDEAVRRDDVDVPDLELRGLLRVRHRKARRRRQDSRQETLLVW